MNSALDNLYDELLRQVDEGPAEEEITEAEKAKRFLEEKQIAIEKLKEISLKKLEEETKRKEEARLRELERKRQGCNLPTAEEVKLLCCGDELPIPSEKAAIELRLLKEKKEKEMIRDIEDKTMRFWKRDVTGKRQQTGVVYFGDAKRSGDAWVPHGHGEYRVRGEIIYDGTLWDGMMHGEGRLLTDAGEIWAGQLWKDMVHGLGTLIAEDDTKRRAIYWRDRRVCFLDELCPGARIQLLGDEFVRNVEGQATVVCASGREARYRLRLDSGLEKLLRLECEHFRLLRNRPQVLTLDTIVGSTRYKDLYDYEDDQANPQKSAYQENFYYPDLWAAREKKEKEKQAELELQMKRSQILARRQVERDAKTAADQAADIAKGLEERKRRDAEMEKEDAENTVKEKEARALAFAAVEEKRKRQKELSRT